MSTIGDIRAQFPALQTKVYGRPLIYFDNAATAHKPLSVIEMEDRLYRGSYSNVHRAVHKLSADATNAYEEARDAVAAFIGAGSREETIFTSGATASLNLLAHSFVERYVGRGDKILLTEAEHHANIVPWQLACRRAGASLEVVPVGSDGCIDLRVLESHLDDASVKLLALPHISNVLGVVNPVKEIVALAHRRGIPVAVDGAQGIVHAEVNVRDLDCDFYAFSGHKIYAPTGTGVLYGKRRFLEEMPPFMGGGDMIDTVTFEKTSYAPLPLKFEAGTPNFVGAACLKPALETASALRRETEVQLSERQIVEYLIGELRKIDGLRIYGTPRDIAQKAPVISFTVDGAHPSDLAQILDKMGIAVRSGLMCAEPLVRKYSEVGMLRVSLAPYNTMDECVTFMESLHRAINMLRR